MKHTPTLLLTGLLALLTACGQQTASTPQASRGTTPSAQTPAQGPSQAPAVSNSTLNATSLDPNCTTDNTTVLCTYTYTGAAQTFAVPGGVTSVQVVARGAKGGYSPSGLPGGIAGGKGAEVSAALTVSGGETLTLMVGGAGGRTSGGFNGGGSGGGDGGGFIGGGGGGGGASDVRSGGTALDNRVLVAAGGGGAGSSLPDSCVGGAGGNAGSAGSKGQSCSQPGGVGGVAGSGQLGSGGTGGTGQICGMYNAGDGGGGGGGYRGGGGGGGGKNACDLNMSAGGGGGGGSNLVPTGGTASITSEPAAIIVSYTLPSDTSAPKADPKISTGTPGNTGWYTTDVTVAWNWTDENGSGIDPSACPPTSTSVGEGSLTLKASCKDLAGNPGEATFTVNVDKTAPTINPVVNPNPVLLGGNATVTANASDGVSGVQSQSCGTLDTSTVGSKTVTCEATDQAGNTAKKTVTYTVNYPFAGFLQPVDNLPVINTVKAGSAVPVKFSLGGNQGLSILAAGSPKVSVLACDGSAPADEIEQTLATSNSGLSYDATSNTYSYVWKTDKSWAGSCRQLNVLLTDGTSHLANFKFR